MDVLIVGAGSMGTWFGRAVDGCVTVTDVDPEAAREAADAVGATVADLEAEGSYDVVCLAVPMTHVTDAIEAHARRADRAVVDVSGIMEAPLEAMDAAVPDRERLSLHPLFAPERAPGTIAVVRDRSGPATDAILETLEERGNELLETTPSEHDEAMETVQAATHAAVLSFALAVEPAPEGFETPIYEQLEDVLEQLTAGTPRVYADIQGAFDGADAVADAAAEIADAEPAAVESLYQEAAKRWQSDERADETDSTPDRPGDAE
ncbi:prephenate dehydrogenase/arogenate dehydrogenase family protein [Salinadaptatus halalkaliphilus]|uniref:Prephenate dehydrogenase/arogenate dehydrogenase family protein n=1 Tax=Salinadaptatus halalkaliphilus TaxID=2419781 RepID=A0A4S3TNZ3_9EURY|nr:prephenate dehydrogenase/arogenate dehydrogenase family protein [Salinadaptatus halalkaliphilus]THE66044.1 prephenate dehydrogenase/arogenate dehydrogenase family protein [Salinadaptatus halalkaliphilus]